MFMLSIFNEIKKYFVNTHPIIIIAKSKQFHESRKYVKLVRIKP